MDKDYYLLGEILWGMKDYFHNSNENKGDYFSNDNKIDLGTFDGLTNCYIYLNPSEFSFLAGNYSGTPQYEKDKRRFYLFYNNLHDEIYFINEVENENILEILIKILSIKIPKDLLDRKQQQIIKNSGILENSKDAIPKIIKKLIIIDNNGIVNEASKILSKKQI